MSKIKLNPNDIIVLVGAMDVGKSTFAKHHFASHEIIETDAIRASLSGDFQDQSQNKAVFDILYATIDARMEAGVFTVIDSTGSKGVLQRVSELATKYNRVVHAIQFPALDPSEIIKERMKHRMRVLDVYHNQVKRVNETVYQSIYNVYKLDNVNDVEFEYASYDDGHILDSGYRYIVVPDLHGEYDVLERYWDAHQDKDDIRFVFLGDIVDRGKSSYETFKLVSEIIDSGKGFAVISNHDDKVMRYFKKWVADDDDDKYLHYSKDELPDYGMRISGGIDTTLTEFYSLYNHEQDAYANDFIAYYLSLPMYLKVHDGNQYHFFSHAGVSQHMLDAKYLDKRDKVDALYTAIDEDGAMELYNEAPVTLHVGHENRNTFITQFEANNITVIKHDVGLGKVMVGTDTINFLVIET